VTVRAQPRFGEAKHSSPPPGNPRGRSQLRPWASNRVASAPRSWLRPRWKRRGSTRSLASARVQVKLVATMFARGAVTRDCVPCRTAASAKARRSSRSLCQRTVPDDGFGQRPTQRLHHPPRAIRLRCLSGLPGWRRRLGPRSFGRVFRNRMRSSPSRANRWLCPANSPLAQDGKGVRD
jgi:hypothetical protein